MRAFTALLAILASNLALADNPKEPVGPEKPVVVTNEVLAVEVANDVLLVSGTVDAVSLDLSRPMRPSPVPYKSRNPSKSRECSASTC